MARYSAKGMPKPTQDQLWDEFCDLVVALSSRQQVRKFFADLFNRPERLMFARRLHIAALLEAGYTYDEIKETLGVGASTVSRVHRWVEFGRGGYRSAIRAMPEKDPKKLKAKYATLYRHKVRKGR